MNKFDKMLQALGRLSPRIAAALSRWVQHIRLERYWRYRTRLTVECPDNAHIKRTPDAGRIVGDCQVMHNGIRVYYGSYSWAPERMHEILRRNRGVHEPQEERVFAAVLAAMPQGGVMVELGACWAFYSLWFARSVKNARVYLVEADASCLRNGIRNFALNGLEACGIRAWAAGTSGQTAGGETTLSIDDFVSTRQLDRIAILHSDIQGAELDMLAGAERTLRAGKIDYLFISTHSDAIHDACAGYLEGVDYTIIASASVRQSYSCDGILVAKRRELPNPGPIAISRLGSD